MTSHRITSLFGILFLLALFCEARPLARRSGFIQTRGTQFVQNGSPFFFNGFNSYWMMNVASDPNQRYKVSNVFRDAAAAGLTVCRTWAFSDGGSQALQISPGVYDERVFQVLLVFYLHFSNILQGMSTSNSVARVKWSGWLIVTSRLTGTFHYFNIYLIGIRM